MGWRSPHRDLGSPKFRRVLQSLEKSLDTGLLPAGACTPWIGDTAPDGWVLMHGQTLTGAKDQYPELWSVVNATWKSGNNIVVPDLRGRVPVGLDNMGGSDAGRLSVANTMGGSGGAETHTLTSSEMPSHSHTVYGQSDYGNGANAFGVSTMTATTSNGNKTTTSTGGGGAHNNMQPYLLLNWILKVA